MKQITNILKRTILAATLLTLGAATTRAEDTPDDSEPIRPVLSAWTVGIGSSHLADTYLTPLKYSGWGASVGYERMQASPWSPRDWVMQLKVSADMDRTQNPAHNATMWAAQLHASWGVMRRWSLPCGLRLGIGPALRLEGGCLYNARNSNNPASAKGAVTFDAIAYAAMDVKLWRLPVTLRYQPSMPVIGAFFSPEYDELYYELYLGNHSGVVHPAWWGNRFKLDNLVTADLHFGSTALRLGYECNWMSSRASNLTTRMITHRFILGVTVDWISHKPSKKSVNPF